MWNMWIVISLHTWYMRVCSYIYAIHNRMALLIIEKEMLKNEYYCRECWWMLNEGNKLECFGDLEKVLGRYNLKFSKILPILIQRSKDPTQNPHKPPPQIPLMKMTKHLDWLKFQNFLIFIFFSARMYSCLHIAK